MGTHYEVLGIAPSATSAQVRRAYHDKARQLHPDRYVGQPEDEVVAARRAMQDVNEAWRVLRDPSARAAYDRSLRATPPVGASRHVRSRRRRQRALAVSVRWLAAVAVIAAVLVMIALARA